MKNFILSIIFTLNALSFSISTSFALPEGFVYVQEVIPDIAVDLRYFGSNNFVGRTITGYEEQRAILTKETAQALAEVQKELRPMHLGLLIYDAYRPKQAVKDIFAWGKNIHDTKTKHIYYPDIEKIDIFKRGFLASSESSHSRGSTVDITIVPLVCHDNICKPCSHCLPLDMATPFDFFGDPVHSDYTEITPQQRANRLLLQTVMKKHGFRQATGEYWHFTLINEPFPHTYFDFPVK